MVPFTYLSIDTNNQSLCLRTTSNRGYFVSRELYDALIRSIHISKYNSSAELINKELLNNLRNIDRILTLGWLGDKVDVIPFEKGYFIPPGNYKEDIIKLLKVLTGRVIDPNTFNNYHKSTYPPIYKYGEKRKQGEFNGRSKYGASRKNLKK